MQYRDITNMHVKQRQKRLQPLLGSSQARQHNNYTRMQCLYVCINERCFVKYKYSKLSNGVLMVKTPDSKSIFHFQKQLIGLLDSSQVDGANLRQGQNLNKNWSGIRIQISVIIRIRFRILPDSSQNFVDSLSCHFAECRENRPTTVWEMLINLLKFIGDGMRFNGDGSGKVLQNPYPGPDQQQKLTNSFDW